MKNGIVRFETKIQNDNKKRRRIVYMDDELKEVFEKQWQMRKNAKALLPYVFLNRHGNDKVKRFYKAWNKACQDAGIGVKIFHDLRRAAVRNMVRSGVPERVAMSISGHKIRAVFDRYNIVNEQDLHEASKRLSEYLNSQTGTNLSTIPIMGEAEKLVNDQ